MHDDQHTTDPASPDPYALDGLAGVGLAATSTFALTFSALISATDVSLGTAALLGGILAGLCAMLAVVR